MTRVQAKPGITAISRRLLISSMIHPADDLSQERQWEQHSQSQGLFQPLRAWGSPNPGAGSKMTSGSRKQGHVQAKEIHLEDVRTV